MDAFDVNLDVNVRKRLYFGRICERQYGKECKECEKADELFRLSRAETDEGKKKLLEDQGRGLYAKSRIFINAINTRDEDKAFPIRIYAIPPLVYDELISIIRGARQLNPNRNVFHPVTGYNVLISKRGSGVQTRYTVQLADDPSEIPNKEVLRMLQEGDRSCLHNLNKIEEFIEDNYLHITALGNDSNFLRLLPPFEDQTIYKELKFHRFSISSYKRIGAEAAQSSPDQSLGQGGLDGPGFDEQGKQDEFNPSMLDNIPDFGSGNDMQQESNPHPSLDKQYATAADETSENEATAPLPTDKTIQTVEEGTEDKEDAFAALKEGIKKIEGGASKEETDRILEKIRQMTADSSGSA